MLPTFNSARWIIPQVESILAQTCPPERLIILDDSSTDETVGLLRRHYGANFRVDLRANQHNVGQNACVESLLGSVETPYFATADHDDVWARHKLEKSLHTLQASDADLAYSDLVVVNADLQEIDASALRSSRLFPLAGTEPTPLFIRNPIHGCTIVGRTALLEEALPFPRGISYYDRWLGVLAASRGGIAYVDEALVLYRQHDGNAVGTLASGVRGLRTNLARHRTGRVADYLVTRLDERLALLDGLADRGPLVRRLGFLRWFYSAGRFPKLALLPGYVGLMATYGRKARPMNLLFDLPCTLLAAAPATAHRRTRVRV